MKFTMKFPLHRYTPNTPIDREYPIVAYCAEEVRRQGDSPWHVWRMYDAWMFAMEMHDNSPLLSHLLIRECGRMMDEENYMGYRDGHVFIGDQMKSYPESIHSEMDVLIKDINAGNVTAIGAYARFEETHPFFDGNGRTGKIIYNWVNGTLGNPVWPIDLYGGITNP